jgi:hypothetical protein
LRGGEWAKNPLTYSPPLTIIPSGFLTFILYIGQMWNTTNAVGKEILMKSFTVILFTIALTLFVTGSIFAADPGLIVTLAGGSPQGNICSGYALDLMKVSLYARVDCRVTRVEVRVIGLSDVQSFDIGFWDEMNAEMLGKDQNVQLSPTITTKFQFGQDSINLVKDSYKTVSAKGFPIPAFSGNIQVVIQHVNVENFSGQPIEVSGLPLFSKLLSGRELTPQNQCEVIKNQLKQLKAQLESLGNKSKDLKDQLRAQIAALEDALKRLGCDNKFKNPYTFEGQNVSYGILGADRKISFGEVKIASECPKLKASDFQIYPYDFGVWFQTKKGVKVQRLTLKVDCVGNPPLTLSFQVDGKGSGLFQIDEKGRMKQTETYPPLDGFGAPPKQNSGDRATTWGDIKTR